MVEDHGQAKGRFTETMIIGMQFITSKILQISASELRNSNKPNLTSASTSER